MGHVMIIGYVTSHNKVTITNLRPVKIASFELSIHLPPILIKSLGR